MNPRRIAEDTDAKAWLLKHAGKEVTEKLFHELYAVNKFNIPLGRISAKQFASRLKAKEALGPFGYPSAGLAKMIDSLAKKIAENGGCIAKEISITSIDLKKKIVKTDKTKFPADIVVNSIAIPAFLKLAKGLPKHYSNQLSKIKYCPVVGLVIGTKDFLGKHYWYNVLKERTHMIVQNSYLYDGYSTKISWISRYGGSEQDIIMSDEEIKDAYLRVVEKYFPKAKILWAKVFREWYSSPIYDKDYPRYKPDYRSPVDGLYHTGIAATFPEIRNMNTALKSGIRVARLVKEDHGLGQ